MARCDPAVEEFGDEATQYEQAMPLWQSYAGLERYWEKRRTRA